MPRQTAKKHMVYRCPECGAGLNQKICLDCRGIRHKKRKPLNEALEDNCDFGAYLPTPEEITLAKQEILAANEASRVGPKPSETPCSVRQFGITYQGSNALLRSVG